MQRIFLSLLLVSLVTTSLTLEARSKKPKAESLKLEDIFASNKFGQRSVYGVNSLKDGKHYASIVYGQETSIVIYNYESGAAIDTLVRTAWLTPKDSTKPIQFSGYLLSEDENLVLLSTQREKIYRYSSRENNFIFNRTTREIRALSPNGKQAYASFSPDGKQLAFMRDNNIFVTNLSNYTETQLTFDGKMNEIINGGTDWVYEEEFGFTRAFFWSPDSKKILYYKFDERAVPEFVMPIYDGLYPTNYTFKYPKAGEKNATVKLFICDLGSMQHSEVATGSENDQYIARAGWTADASTAWMQRLNRHQNKLELMAIDAQSGQTRVILTETSEQWVDVHDDLNFLSDKKRFIWSSERSGYNQLYLYSMEGELLQTLTSGEYEVTNFYGLRESDGSIFYASAYPTPMERTIYKANLKGDAVKLSPGRGKHSASFSKDFSYFLLFHTDANSPLTVSLHKDDGNRLRVLEDNAALRERLAKHALSKKEFFEIDNGEGTRLNAYMIKPANFNPKKKYPVLMFVYGGPGSQTVDASFGQYYMWFQYLAQQGYVVVSVDNRGTGYRGVSFKKATYQQLGKYELEDQIAAARYLGTQPYIDRDRIAMFGWSYGGYMSSLAITKGAGIFKTAVAVAPVINWRFYDTIYTERYMRTPQENASGYDDNSPSTHADKLQGNYLLIHGTADDNVHFQNALVMVDRLVNANKQFEFMAYTDKDHGIYGGMTRLQLFTKITAFLNEKL
ncbi:MAG: S9 family peptidase [Bacteroidia bacterium]